MNRAKPPSMIRDILVADAGVAGLDLLLGGLRPGVPAGTWTVHDAAHDLLNNGGANAPYKLLGTANNLLWASWLSPYITSATLSQDALNVSFKDAQSLSSLPQFSNGGHAYTVTGRINELSMAPAFSGVTGYMLAASGHASVAQLSVLRGLPGFSFGGHGITVSDTVANLLADQNIPEALGYILVGNDDGTAVSLSVAEATALHALPNFHIEASYNIVDTAAKLLANQGFDNAVAYKLSESGSQLTVAEANALTAILGYDANGCTYHLVDTAAKLLANQQFRNVAAQYLSEQADNLSVAEATALHGLPGFTRSRHGLTVRDTADQLLTRHSVAGVVAYRLSANASDLSVASARALTGLAGFDACSHTYTLSDTASQLAGAASIVSGAAGYRIVDTATGILGADTALLAGATSVRIIADTVELARLRWPNCLRWGWPTVNMATRWTVPIALAIFGH
jgi:hypothetical protein